MSRARDLADSADKDIAGTLTVDGLTVENTDANTTLTGSASASIVLQDTGASTSQQVTQLLNNDGDFVIRSLNDTKTGVVSTIMTMENLTGNVGIGVTPEAWTFTALQLKTAALYSNNSNDTFLGSNFYYDGSNKYINSDYATAYGQQEGQHIWYTAPSGTADAAVSFTQAMTLDSSGNLLVGKTSDVLNTVGATLGAAGYVTGSRDNGTPISANRKSSDGTLIGLYKDGSTVGAIASKAGTNIIVGTGNCALSFQTGTVRPRTTSDGTSDGVNDLGTSDSRFKDLYLSGGVYLGGTGSANHLDDYEEGTWTPTITGSSSNPTVTYGASTGGQYTKIGNVVMVKCDIYIDAISGGGGTARIDGLPFSASGAPAWDSAVCRDGDAIKLNGQNYRVSGWHGTSLFYLTVVGSTSDCGDINLGLSDIGTGRIQFTSWFTV